MSEVAPWMQTASGLAVDLLKPSPTTITLGDIAHHLARISRFNGATVGDIAWNVAQHCVLVADLMPEESPPALLLAALLHDAPEAYTGDMIAPMKAALRSPQAPWTGAVSIYPLKTIDGFLQSAIHQAFALPNPLPEEWLAAIKHADLQALHIELQQLMAPPPAPWVDLPDTPNPPKLIPLLAPAAQQEFISYALSLIAERHGIIREGASPLSRLPGQPLTLASPPKVGV
jgi:hypothetical protein